MEWQNEARVKKREIKKSFPIKFESVNGRDGRSMYASVSSFAAGSRGIICHKGSAKYITKLQRATKLEISFGSLQLDVAQIDRERPMARVTIPRIYISQFSTWLGAEDFSEIKIFYPILQFHNSFFFIIFIVHGV